MVTSRKGRVSRNRPETGGERRGKMVTSRKGRVSRNKKAWKEAKSIKGHVPQGACE